jgi:hypothetical protein
MLDLRPIGIVVSYVHVQWIEIWFSRCSLTAYFVVHVQILSQRVASSGLCPIIGNSIERCHSGSFLWLL